MVTGKAVSSSNESEAQQPGESPRENARGKKPIRLTDLIPRRDVKGGARTVFGASKVRPENTPRKAIPSNQPKQPKK